MEILIVKNKKRVNLKPNSWYNDFYGDWLFDVHMKSNFYHPTLEELTQAEINYDKLIDDDRYLEHLKHDISDRKEFISKNNNFERNEELLKLYYNRQLDFEVKTGETQLEFNLLCKELIQKCFRALEQGFLITNQLFMLDKWFGDD